MEPIFEECRPFVDYEFVIWLLVPCRGSLSKVHPVSQGIALVSRQGFTCIQSKTMIVRKPLALSLIALAIAAPGLASASSLYHPAGGEAGFTTHPDHFQSAMSRADALQAVTVARKDGTLAIIARGGALPVKAMSPSKTREQVQQEYLSMSAAEKQRMKELYSGS